MAGHAGFGVVLPVPRRVADLAAELGGTVAPGLGDAVVARVVEPGQAERGDDLAVVASARRLGEVSASGVVLGAANLASRLPQERLWAHEHVLWVVARLLSSVEPPRAPGIARSAVIHPLAVVDASATVSEGAVVHAGARVGAGAVIGEGAIIHERTVIGPRVIVGANAVIGRPGFGFVRGPAADLVRIPQLGGVVIEEDAEIGPLATIDAGTLSPTVIERGAKLDAQVHVGHNVRVGAFTMVAAQSGFAGSTRIGRGVLVGGQVGVADHLRIGDGARLAAGSGVITDVAPGAAVAGYPAVPRFSWLRAWARLTGGTKGRR